MAPLTDFAQMIVNPVTRAELVLQLKVAPECTLENVRDPDFLSIISIAPAALASFLSIFMAENIFMIQFHYKAINCS